MTSHKKQNTLLPWLASHLTGWGWNFEERDEGEGAGNSGFEQASSWEGKVDRWPGLGRSILTTLHVVDEVLFQSVPADVGVTVIEITVSFSAVFAAELLSFSARDGVE